MSVGVSIVRSPWGRMARLCERPRRMHNVVGKPDAKCKKHKRCTNQMSTSVQQRSRLTKRAGAHVVPSPKGTHTRGMISPQLNRLPSNIKIASKMKTKMNESARIGDGNADPAPCALRNRARLGANESGTRHLRQRRCAP